MERVRWKVVLLLLFARAAMGGHIVTWNDQTACGPLPDDNDFVAVAAGLYHKLALRMDGSIFACGDNRWGECNVPDGNYVAIGCGYTQSLAVRSDGTLAAWGDNDKGACDVPGGNDYIGVDGGWDFSVAIKSNGSLVGWGRNWHGECDVPGGNDFVAVDCATNHCLALRQDGTLAAWGENIFGECNVPDFNDFVAIGTGEGFSMAIQSDGTPLGWGKGWPECMYDGNDPNNDDCNVPRSYKAADGGYGYIIAIRSDGSVVQRNSSQEFREDINLPGANDCVAISVCGHDNNIALTSNETALLTVNTDPKGLIGGEPGAGEHSYYLGKWVHIRASRATKCPGVYDFDHWSGDVPDPNAASQYIIMDSDKTITAHYVPDEKRCGDECHPILQGDLNEDCYINFDDFAIYAASWLSCTHPDCD